MGRRFLLRPLENRVNEELIFPALCTQHKTYPQRGCTTVPSVMRPSNDEKLRNGGSQKLQIYSSEWVEGLSEPRTQEMPADVRAIE